MVENHAGVALGMRKGISYKILDNINDDFIGVQIESIKGPIVIYTAYIPPRRNYLPVGDFKRAAQHTIPVYVMGDLNAQNPTTGYNYSNNKGRIISKLIARGVIWGVLGGNCPQRLKFPPPPPRINLPPSSPTPQEVTAAGFPLFLQKFKCVITLTSHLATFFFSGD